VIVWRICKSQYKDDAFSGVGGLYCAGRWNNQGSKIVYTSLHPALAQLEILAHIGENIVLKEMFWVIEAELNDDAVDSLDTSALGNNWKENLPITRAIGDQWLKRSESVGLEVPSVVCPLENNVLLNPVHPDFRKSLKVLNHIDLGFDERLLGRR
jgi:RES domain-containing protein